MDKLSKDHYIQAYIERQKTYLHSYTSEGLDQRSPTSVQHQNAENPSFGFGTPVVLPRVIKPIVNPNARTHRSSPPKATQRKTLNAGKENKGSEHVSLDATQRDSSKRKRKKAVIPSCSDDEREARLSERRTRKRVKRSIVKPHTNIAVRVSSVSSEGQKNKVPRKKGKKRSGIDGLALLHGLSATNVGKNRLTLQPLAPLGVFNKGKASTKVKVSSAKKLGKTLFSELAFLEGTAKQPCSLMDESVVRDSSSRLPSPSPKQREATNYRKDKGSTRSTSRDSSAPNLCRGTPDVSEIWDIELQSNCPSSDRLSPRPDQRETASLTLDPRMASWHSCELPTKDQVMHSATPMKATLHDRPTKGAVSPASAVATVYDIDCDSSVHPSHSASQIGLRRVDRLKSPKELLTSRYFFPAVHANRDIQCVPPKLDQPQPVECQDAVRQYADDCSGTISNYNPCIAVSFPRYTSTMLYNPALNDSSPLRVHGISQEQLLPLADDLVPDYRIFSTPQASCSTEHDLLTPYDPDDHLTEPPEGDMNFDYHNPQDYEPGFLEPPEFVNTPSFCSPVQAYFSDGPHHSPEFDMVLSDRASESASQLVEHTQDPSQCEHSDVALERYQDSLASSNSCLRHPFLQGRAMLLGISSHVPTPDTEQMSAGNGLLSVEVDVAKRLKDHWRPHRL